LAAWLAWRRSAWAPAAVLLANALLVIELLVQIPFLGFSILQLIFGAVAIGMAVVAILARRAGWRP
jgi:tellurite resistance protein TehA-like permease